MYTGTPTPTHHRPRAALQPCPPLAFIYIYISIGWVSVPLFFFFFFFFFFFPPPPLLPFFPSPTYNRAPCKETQFPASPSRIRPAVPRMGCRTMHCQAHVYIYIYIYFVSGGGLPLSPHANPSHVPSPRRLTRSKPFPFLFFFARPPARRKKISHSTPSQARIRNRHAHTQSERTG